MALRQLHPTLRGVKKNFTHTQYYLEFLDRCREICNKHEYELAVYDGDNEVGYEPDVIFEMSPIIDP